MTFKMSHAQVIKAQYLLRSKYSLKLSSADVSRYSVLQPMRAAFLNS